MSEQNFPLHPSERGYKSDKELLAEAAAFLDLHADRVARWAVTGEGELPHLIQEAADCRAMAKKLRGET